MDTEIRPAHDLEVVGRARMSNREIVGCGIREADECIDIREVWIIYNLTITVILHHDDIYMVQSRHARGYGPLRSEPGRRGYNTPKAQKRDTCLHCVLSSF